MRRFPIDHNYAALLEAQGVDPKAVLRRAGLPADLFSRPEAALANAEYLRFMEAVDWAIDDPAVPVALATSERIESVSPPIFAAYCSADALRCIRRLAQYKALAGAVSFTVDESDDAVAVDVTSAEGGELPEIIVGIEMCLLVSLIRRATREEIVPAEVRAVTPFSNPEYERYLGREAEAGPCARIAFSTGDALLPFVSRNDTLWGFLEPELRRRLEDVDVDDSFAARVRDALVELLPAGRCGIDDVSRALAVSRRTCQRRLADEGTTFQRQLNRTREILAKNYLANTRLSSIDVAFLLGYQDVNSFYRAFALWTGDTVTAYKAGLAEA